jgi:hypothetical protein
MPGMIVSGRRFIAKLAKSGTVTRMETRTPQKLYAYVDESGQDTLGAFFVVATVLTADNQERVRQALERLERASGKGLRKWVKATPRQRLAYMTPVLQLPALHGRLFVAHFTDTTAYVPCVLTAIARAVITGAAGQPARATILIDGLQKGIRQHAAAALRAQLQPQQIRLEKVRGLNEQSDALMRLADALAGFVRHGLEGRPHMAPLLAESHRQEVLHLIQA